MTKTDLMEMPLDDKLTRETSWIKKRAMVGEMSSRPTTCWKRVSKM